MQSITSVLLIISRPLGWKITFFCLVPGSVRSWVFSLRSQRVPALMIRSSVGLEIALRELIEMSGKSKEFYLFSRLSLRLGVVGERRVMHCLVVTSLTVTSPPPQEPSTLHWDWWKNSR